MTSRHYTTKGELEALATHMNKVLSTPKDTKDKIEKKDGKYRDLYKIETSIIFYKRFMVRIFDYPRFID